jgi:2-amino-4-hydroxy-6-hydroxymethyldihydropteridine diphosphokinase
MRAWIGLGGNLDQSVDALTRALERLGAHPGIDSLRFSSFYRSAPWGLAEQDDFVNAVAEVETALGPEALMTLLLDIEGQLGRRRDGPRWGPRLVDLDLLSYQDEIRQTEFLQLPHPRMHRRAFVLVPLLQLQPEFVIAGVGRARDCLEQFDPAEIASVRAVNTRNEKA